MDAFEGTFQTPQANEMTKKRIKTQKFVSTMLLVSMVIICGVLYFALTQAAQGLDPKFILALIAVEAVVMISISLHIKSSAVRVEKVVDRVRNQEILFFGDRLELAATTFWHPNPKAALTSQNPYLKLQYRDMESVRFVTASKVPAAVRITLMTGKYVSIYRDVFTGVEDQFLDALRSHGVKVG